MRSRILVSVVAIVALPVAALFLVSDSGASGRQLDVNPVSRMLQPRSGHSATLLPDGTVLIAGGMVRNGEFLRTAEIFDPATLKFHRTGDMTAERVGQATVLLQNGKVLLAGGWSITN